MAKRSEEKVYVGKPELIDGVCDLCKDIKKSDIKAVIDTFLSIVKLRVAHGDHVVVHRFGTFDLKKTGGYTKHSSLNGGMDMKVPERMRPRFRPSKSFLSVDKGN